MTNRNRNKGKRDAGNVILLSGERTDIMDRIVTYIEILYGIKLFLCMISMMETIISIC